MRSVFCWVLRHGSSSNPLARSSPDHRGAFQAALNAVVAEERALEDLGSLTRSYEPSKRLVRASGSGRPDLLYTTGGATPDYLRLQLIHSAALREGVAAERNGTAWANLRPRKVHPVVRS
jgi:hypothetical protein